MYCSTNCTLQNSAGVPKDFQIATPIVTSGVRIEVDSWYGAGGGLSGVEIFQSGKETLSRPKKATK
jgi:hypothetical protein